MKSYLLSQFLPFYFMGEFFCPIGRKKMGRIMVSRTSFSGGHLDSCPLKDTSEDRLRFFFLLPSLIGMHSQGSYYFPMTLGVIISKIGFIVAVPSLSHPAS